MVWCNIGSIARCTSCAGSSVLSGDACALRQDGVTPDVVSALGLAVMHNVKRGAEAAGGRVDALAQHVRRTLSIAAGCTEEFWLKDQNLIQHDVLR